MRLKVEKSDLGTIVVRQNILVGSPKDSIIHGELAFFYTFI